MEKGIRTIWRNDDYYEWEKAVQNDPDFTEEEITYERYADDRVLFLDDERANLDVDVQGVIVAFVNLGLWNGRHNGAALMGTNVKDILEPHCDYTHWYCDRYNVKCTESHHDGTNYIVYRVAKDEETARRLMNKIAYEGMTEEQFYKATKSLRPYVSNVYGWG